jgi:hypothetical protein
VANGMRCADSHGCGQPGGRDKPFDDGPVLGRAKDTQSRVGSPTQIRYAGGGLMLLHYYLDHKDELLAALGVLLALA